MKHRIMVTVLLTLLLLLAFLIPVLTLMPVGAQMATALPASTPTPSPTPVPPTPILTVRGSSPVLAATASYLLDMDTGNILENVNGYKTLPMASTTKIMTALIALEAGNLNQSITITQAELDQVPADASSANLVVGDTLTLKDLLYAMMVPSGDDGAVVIADALGGTTNHFVTLMNLFAQRLHLFQTHYDNPHGLNLAGDPNHYTSASDLAQLADYAMHIPLFAQIVQTQEYKLTKTNQHSAYDWTTTNTLLGPYQGLVGVKTGHTDAAGWCQVLAADRAGHHLIGIVLNDPSEAQRDRDAATLLNWGFALPVLPPSP